MGPEDKVKRALKLALDSHPDAIDHFTVMTRGLGSSGVPDRCGTFMLHDAESTITPGGAIFGIAFRIECKGHDNGKKAQPTALQNRSLEANAMRGGFSAVCRPNLQSIYLSDGSGIELAITPAELVEYMLSGAWIRCLPRS